MAMRRHPGSPSRIGMTKLQPQCPTASSQFNSPHQHRSLCEPRQCNGIAHHTCRPARPPHPFHPRKTASSQLQQDKATRKRLKQSRDKSSPDAMKPRPKPIRLTLPSTISKKLENMPAHRRWKSRCLSVPPPCNHLNLLHPKACVQKATTLRGW